MTPSDAFRLGFLEGCLRLGLDPAGHADKAAALVETGLKSADDAGLLASDPALAWTGGLSGLAAPAGHKLEGMGRGLGMGVGLGMGGGLGGLLGSILGSLGRRATPARAAVGGILGRLLGGYAGYKGTQRLMGDPSWAPAPAAAPTMPKAAGHVAGSDPLLALTGGLSAPFATDTGNRTEAYGRGALLDTGAALGGVAGGSLGAAAGDALSAQGRPGLGALIALLGLGGGAYAGYKGSQGLLGKPSWRDRWDRENETNRRLADQPAKAAGVLDAVTSPLQSLGSTAVSWGIPAAIAAPWVLGGAAGYGAGRLSDVDDRDVDEIKQQELKDELGRQTQMLKQTRLARLARERLQGGRRGVRL